MRNADGELRPWLWWLPALAVMAGIFVLSSQSGLHVTEDVDVERPIRVSGHFIAYAVLAGCLLLALTRGGRPRATYALAAWLLAVGYGLTDEFHQSFVPDRMGRLNDVAVDAIGAAAGVVIAWVALTAWAKARESTAPEEPA